MNCKEWRKNVKDLQKNGEKLEAFALNMGLEDFNIDPYSWHTKLEQNIQGETIQKFSERVKKLVDLLGSADYVKTNEDGTDIQAPTMIAMWVVYDFFVEITSKEPQCKIDPRQSYRPTVYGSTLYGQSTLIHPECQSVLEELSEL